MKSFPTALLLILTWPVLVFAQTSSSPSPTPEARLNFKNSIYTNFLSPISRTYNIGYERALNRRFSAFFSLLSGNILPQGQSSSKTNYFRQKGLTGGVKYYFRPYPGKSQEDFYLGPYFRYLDMELSDFAFGEGGFLHAPDGSLIISKNTGKSFKTGIQAGTRQVYFRRLALDFFGGIHYQTGSGIPRASSEVINLIAQNGVSFRLGITAGFCF